jgi:hypothetical protein
MVKPLDIKTCWGFESSEIYLTTLPRRPVQVTRPGLDIGAGSSTFCRPRDLLKLVYHLLRHVCALFHGRGPGGSSDPLPTDRRTLTPDPRGVKQQDVPRCSAPTYKRAEAYTGRSLSECE